MLVDFSKYSPTNLDDDDSIDQWQQGVQVGLHEFLSLRLISTIMIYINLDWPKKLLGGKNKV